MKPNMPKWFEPAWRWAGRADDVLGRLRVLRNAALFGLGAFLIVGIVLMKAFGLWGAVAFLFGFGCAVFAITDLLVWRRAEKAGIAPHQPGGSVSPSGHLKLKKIPSNASEPEEIVVADWDTSCRYVAASIDSSGRGVHLSITGKRGIVLDLRCVVIGPDGSRFEDVSGQLFGSRSTAELDVHFPGEFRPSLEAPWPVGYYIVRWLGDSGDIGEANVTHTLGQRWFRVLEDGIIKVSSSSRGDG